MRIGFVSTLCAATVISSFGEQAFTNIFWGEAQNGVQVGVSLVGEPSGFEEKLTAYVTVKNLNSFDVGYNLRLPAETALIEIKDARGIEVAPREVPNATFQDRLNSARIFKNGTVTIGSGAERTEAIPLTDLFVLTNRTAYSLNIGRRIISTNGIHIEAEPVVRSSVVTFRASPLRIGESAGDGSSGTGGQPGSSTDATPARDTNSHGSIHAPANVHEATSEWGNENAINSRGLRARPDLGDTGNSGSDLARRPAGELAMTGVLKRNQKSVLIVTGLLLLVIAGVFVRARGRGKM